MKANIIITIFGILWISGAWAQSPEDNSELPFGKYSIFSEIAQASEAEKVEPKSSLKLDNEYVETGPRTEDSLDHRYREKDEITADPGKALLKPAEATAGESEPDSGAESGPGEEISDAFENLISEREQAEFEYDGRLFIWRDGRPFEKNPDGSVTAVEVPENLYTTDEYGQKWLSREVDGTIYIDLAPKIWAIINFAHNSDEIEDSSKPVLDAFGISLNSPALNNHRLIIGGHTNSLGNRQYNLKLSQRRAQSVSRYLTEAHNIAPERLILHGYGDTKPIADNASEEGLELNRRVEFILLGPREDNESTDSE